MGLFHITILNNWHVTLFALEAITGPSALIFLMSFYAFGVLVVMNLVVAFFLEAAAFVEKEKKDAEDVSIMGWRLDDGDLIRRNFFEEMLHEDLPSSISTSSSSLSSSTSTREAFLRRGMVFN